MYAKARRGEIKGFTGVDDPYEEPLNPEVVCKTGEETVEQSVDKIVAFLEKKGYIPAAEAAAV
jgi:adenylylsulfate kinase